MPLPQVPDPLVQPLGDEQTLLSLIAGITGEPAATVETRFRQEQRLLARMLQRRFTSGESLRTPGLIDSLSSTPRPIPSSTSRSSGTTLCLKTRFASGSPISFTLTSGDRQRCLFSATAWALRACTSLRPATKSLTSRSRPIACNSLARTFSPPGSKFKSFSGRTNSNPKASRLSSAWMSWSMFLIRQRLSPSWLPRFVRAAG